MADERAGCVLHDMTVAQVSREIGGLEDSLGGFEARLRELETCTAVLTSNQTTLTTLVAELKNAMVGMSDRKSDFLWEIARGVMQAVILFALFKGGSLIG